MNETSHLKIRKQINKSKLGKDITLAQYYVNRKTNKSADKSVKQIVWHYNSLGGSGGRQKWRENIIS